MVEQQLSAQLGATIDDLLGPASGRFFGNGYRRIGQHVGGFSWDSADRSLRAVAGVVYPADWSVKQLDQSLAPHLSTIDGLVLAAQLSDAALTLDLGLDAEQRRTMWLRRVEIRAGSQPDELGLDALPASAQVQPAQGEALLDGHRISLVVCRVGRMTVRCTVEHPAGRGTQGTPPRPEAEPGAELLGAAGQRVYGTGYQRCRQLLTEVTADPDAAEPTALAWLALTDDLTDPPADQGLEGAFQPGLTLVDAFVAALQLGQVLLYELDGVSRSESSTLWMRRTVLTAETPPTPLAEAVPVTVELNGAQVLDSREALWRSADIQFRGAGVGVLCAVTHRLPERDLQAAR
jgi:hypothetical protein